MRLENIGLNLDPALEPILQQQKADWQAKMTAACTVVQKANLPNFHSRDMPRWSKEMRDRDSAYSATWQVRDGSGFTIKLGDKLRPHIRRAHILSSSYVVCRTVIGLFPPDIDISRTSVSHQWWPDIFRYLQPWLSLRSINYADTFKFYLTTTLLRSEKSENLNTRGISTANVRKGHLIESGWHVWICLNQSESCSRLAKPRMAHMANLTQGQILTTRPRHRSRPASGWKNILNAFHTGLLRSPQVSWTWIIWTLSTELEFVTEFLHWF